MYKISFLNKNKIVFEKEFKSRQEADDFIFCETHSNSYEYQITDIEKDEIIDEGQLESDNDITDMAMNNLFPDEESNEGFDIDDHLGIT